jgi:hypothetical protein
MHGEAIYQAWAPDGGAWSLWVKPVLFAQMPDAAPDMPWLSIPAWVTDGTPFIWAPARAECMALVLDLPREEAVHLGLALATRHGYRPVPLYNAATGRRPSELIVQFPIQCALRDGAAILTSLSLPMDAPPAFLLDSQRQGLPRTLLPGMLDNRWKVYPEDFPSGEKLQERSITQVMVVHAGKLDPLFDLVRVLRYWQEAGISVKRLDLWTTAGRRDFILPQRIWIERAFDSFMKWFGAYRSPRDGFGYVVPQPRHG